MKVIYKNISIISVLIFFGLMMKCDNILPQQYQEVDQPEVSEIDQRAYQYLTRDLVRQDTIIAGADTSFQDVVQHHKVNSYLLGELQLSDTSITDSSDAFIIDAEFNNLKSQLDTIVSDTTLLIKNSQEGKDSYAFFQAPMSGIVNCYVTWDITEENIDNYIGMEFYDQNGEKANQHPLQMSLETFNEYTEVDTLKSMVRTITKIRSKLSYDLDAKSYFVQFHISEPSVIEEFRLVLLYDENNKK